jgi:hypothetical protein
MSSVGRPGQPDETQRTGTLGVVTRSDHAAELARGGRLIGCRRRPVHRERLGADRNPTDDEPDPACTAAPPAFCSHCWRRAANSATTCATDLLGQQRPLLGQQRLLLRGAGRRPTCRAADRPGVRQRPRSRTHRVDHGGYRRSALAQPRGPSHGLVVDHGLQPGSAQIAQRAADTPRTLSLRTVGRWQRRHRSGADTGGAAAVVGVSTVVSVAGTGFRTGTAVAVAVRTLLRFARISDDGDPTHAIAWPNHPPAVRSGPFGAQGVRIENPWHARDLAQRPLGTQGIRLRNP